MSTVEKYLKPQVVRQISRLDLRAQFIVKGFLQGLHASPFQGFSVEFSEHRKYTPGDDPQDIDWLVYAKTDKYYVKKFEAETNITGYLVMDLSRSMGYTLSAGADQIRIRRQPGRGAVLLDDSSAGSGRADHVRPADAAEPAAAIETHATGQRVIAIGQFEADGPDRYRPQPDADRGHAAASLAGDAVYRFVRRCWNRCWRRCGGCGMAGTT